MLFSFLNYISPMWYYNISSEESCLNHYFVDYRSLNAWQRNTLDIPDCYRHEASVLCDVAFQIHKKGIMSLTAVPLSVAPQIIRSKSIRLFGERSNVVSSDVYVTDVIDNYCFVKRFFSPSHILRIFVCRLLTLHNPILELRGLLTAKKVKRINVYGRCGYDEYKDSYERFESGLVKGNPKVSVIIPTLNRYDYLKDVMADLEKQEFKNFEVIVVDQTEPFNEGFYQGWNMDLHVYQQKEKALWLARNQAIKSAIGDYVLLFDDDSRVDPDWIVQHLKCLDYFKCDISSGVSLSVIGARIPEDYSYFKWSDQIDTGNVMFAKNMLFDTGMFDRQFEGQRQGDGEFGLRSYLCGKTNISNPFAKRIHLKVSQGGLRQMGSWDGLRPKKVFAPRPVPSVIYLCRKYFGDTIARLFQWESVSVSLLPYRYKGQGWAPLVSLLLFILCFPIVASQMCISWRQAGKKLKEGGRIELL